MLPVQYQHTYMIIITAICDKTTTDAMLNKFNVPIV